MSRRESFLLSKDSMKGMSEELILHKKYSCNINK